MAAFNSALHPRVPKGAAGGGEFAKGSAPPPSKKAGKNGSRYSKKQFGQLQSLEKQHQAGKKLTAKQAHALHVAHELHMQHVKAVKARKPKAAAKKTTAKVKKTGRSSIGHRT